jgi:hypothetical protein
MSNDTFNTALNNVFRIGAMSKEHDRPIDRALRRAKELGMNKSGFAKVMGVLPQHITNWVNRGMPAEYHEKAAEVLQWSIEELLGKAKPSKSPQVIWPFRVPYSEFMKLEAGQKREIDEIMEDRVARFRARSNPSTRKTVAS